MKKIVLSVEEWQRLLAVPLEERRKVLKQLAVYTHWKIVKRGFNSDRGPFSFAAMGGNAVVVICQECIDALFAGEWHWKPGWSLLKQLKRMVDSKIGHIIRDYQKYDEMEMVMTSDEDFLTEAEMSLACQLEREANIREMGYEMARDAVKNYPELLAYLDALYEENDYGGIAKRMNMTKNEVKALEKELLTLLEKI